VVKLILLTAARRGEVGGMGVGEVDADGLWTVPAERSKNGRAIERPLPPAAREVLREWSAEKASNGRARSPINPVLGAPVFGFGEDATDGFQGWSRSKRRLDARIAKARAQAGQPVLADWTLHDLRRSVATALGDLEMAMPHVVETLLGHRHERVGSAHAIYNRSGYRREVGRALAAWAEHLMGLVDGRKPASEVVVAFAREQAS